MLPSRPTFATLLAAIGALAACSDATTTAARRPVSITFATAPSAAASNGSVAAATVGEALVITKAQLVLSEFELEKAGASCPDDSPSDSTRSGDDSCPEIEGGPVLVDLPLQGATRTALTVAIPAGTYRELEVEVDAVHSSSDDEPDDDSADDRRKAEFLAAHPEFRGVSVRVEGTYNGAPFVFVTEVEVEVELEFQPALVIDGSNNNMTINLDLASWFRTETGVAIDPRTANAGGQNKSRVDENIKLSIEAYEDDDRDGHRN